MVKKKKPAPEQEKPKSGAGQPTRLTAEVREAILSVVRDGNYRNVAAESAGIAVRTLALWCSKGRKETSGPYVEFLQALLAAEREAEVKAVRALLADPDVKHQAWWLERKFPDRWGKDRDLLRELVKRVKELEARLVGSTPPPAPQG